MPTTLLKLWVASTGSLNYKCGLDGTNGWPFVPKWQQITSSCCNLTAQYLGLLHSYKAAFQILWGMSDSSPDTRIISPTAIIYYASLLCQSLCKLQTNKGPNTDPVAHKNRVSVCVEWKPRARLDWGVDLSWSFKLNSTPSWLCDLRWAVILNLGFRYFSSLI